MFQFDEELFANANDKITESITDLESLDSLINEVTSLSNELSESDVSFIQNDVSVIKDDLKSLKDYAIKTLELVDEMNETDKEELIEAIMEESTEFPTSPFTTGRNGKYGATQRGAYEIFLLYLIDKIRKEREANGEGGGASSPGFKPTSTPPYNPFGVEDEEDDFEDDLYYTQYSDARRQQVETIISLFAREGITDESIIEEVLRYQKNQSCGQSVLTNWICEEYSSKPEEFEEKYGYPLFIEDERGITYNYEVIATDVYLRTNGQFLEDNIVDGEFNVVNEDSSVHPDEMGPDYSLVTGNEAEYYQTDHDISVETYQEYMEAGYDHACIAAYRYDLQPYGSNPETEVYSADRDTEDGHWLTITGISENGNFIVSSWGQEWELVHSDVYAKFPVDGVQNEDRDDACIVFVREK